MNVLHLFSNAKWTGPAEPALNLCVTLRKLGIQTDFACSPGTAAARNKIVETARDRGIEPLLRFRLSKHRRPIANTLDRMALSRYLREQSYDVVHCHLDNDHRIALGPARALGIPVVRSSYTGTGFQGPGGYPKLLSRTEYLLEPSSMAFEYDAAHYGFPRDRMAVIAGAVDLERFDPHRPVPDQRRWLGIPSEAFVFGVVARLQRHRHYEDLFRAFRQLVDNRRNVRLIVVGRGTHQEEVGIKPVKGLGLEGHVHFPGYADGDDYVGMLNAFDALVFLVPGSDGTCRAVREGMAMGKPAVAADRGMIREILDDGVTGFVVDGSVNGLFSALDRLCVDRRLARRIGQAARERAVASYSLETQAKAVAAVYQAMASASLQNAAH